MTPLTMPAAEMPVIPAALADYFNQRRGPASSDRTDGGDTAPKIPDGSRDNYLASLAGSMRKRGMTKHEIEAAITVVNAERCDPPLDKREVERIAWSVSRYDDTDPILADVIRMRYDPTTGSVEQEPESELFARAGFGFIDVANVLLTDPPPYDWLWDGFLERNEMLWLAGAGKTGKSMLALHLGCALLDEDATTFLGVPTGNITHLVYLDAENPEKTIRRRLHLADIPAHLAPRITYGMIRGADLGSDDGIAALEATLRGKPGCLLILDSLIGLHRADEDNAGEVRRFVTGIRKVAEAHGVTVIGLAHENKAGGVRGSTDWRNASDGTLQVQLAGKSNGVQWRQVSAVERRDGDKEPKPIQYCFDVNRDGDGQPRMRILAKRGEPIITSPDDGAPAGEPDDETAIAAIIRAVPVNPGVSSRALAAAVGVKFGRRFRSLAGKAAARDEHVHAWCVKHLKTSIEGK